MTKRLIISLIFALSLGINLFAQGEDYIVAQTQSWKTFNKKGWNKFDFAKKKITKTQLAKVSSDGFVDELSLLRGVLFGKRGRIFKERSIQEYLEKQAWYKPKADFSNAILSKTERDNLDLIRLAEAERHSAVQPGICAFGKQRKFPTIIFTPILRQIGAL